jgi:hypothetical protein
MLSNAQRFKLRAFLGFARLLRRCRLLCVLLLVSYPANAACGPDPAPAQAAAAGFTCETFQDGNPWTLATIDVNNTKAPGFKWYVDMNWPNAMDTAWQSLGINLPGDFSISSGKLVFAPQGPVVYGPGSQHVGNIISCYPTANAPYWGGSAFSGGFYFEVLATWPNGTAHGTEQSWPIAWTWSVTYLSRGIGTTAAASEFDEFEAPFARNYHLWQHIAGNTTSTDNSSSCGGTCGTPASGTKFGVLLVPSWRNNGTAKLDWYQNDVFMLTNPPPSGYTSSVYDFSAKEEMCLLLGAAQSNPATFSTVRLWQAPITGGKRRWPG